MSQARWRYRAWDIHVAVPFPVPDLAEVEPFGEADLELRVGTPPESGAVRFTLPGGARIAMVGQHLAFVEGPVDTARLHPSLLRSLLAVVLRRQGRVVLHAAAVEIDGRTLALAGPTGSGKTTLAAALCADGGRLVSDEVCALAIDGPTAIVFPGTRLLALRPETPILIEPGLTPFSSAGLSETWRNGRILMEVPAVAEAVPLDALYLLDWASAPGVSLARAVGASLIEALLGARFQPAVGPPIEPAHELQAVARLATLSPAFQLRRDRNQPPADIIRALRAHHSSL